MTLPFSTRYQRYDPLVLTAAFDVPFPLFSTEDLDVIVDGVQTEDYSVAGTFLNGRAEDAQVILLTAVTDVPVEIYGARDPRRINQYTGNSPDLAEKLQSDVDALTATQQEQARDFDSAIRVGPQDEPLAPMTGTAADRAGRVPIFSDDGLAINIGPTAADISSAQQAASSAAASAQEAEDFASSITQFSSYADVAAATIPANLDTIEFLSGSFLVKLRRDPSGTAVTTADGAQWSPVPPIRPEHFGMTDTPANTRAAIQAAIDYANTISAKVVLEAQEYETEGFVLKNFVGLHGVNEVVIKRSGSGLLLKTDGFDDFADDVDRSFVWHSSNTARNAQDYAQGQYVMVASSRTDFDNATWWLANSGDTSTDAGWDPVGAVVGCVGAAITGEITFDGVTDAGAGDTLVGLYGIDIKMDGDLKFKNAGTPLHTESPGLVYSVQVGRNLQWSVNGIECSEFSQVGWRAGHQSDGSIYNTKVYAREGVSPILLDIHQKLSGTKWFGGHAWGGDDGTIGAQVGALTNSMFGFEFERPVVVQQGGFQFYGQAYRANDVSSEDGAAFVLEANVSGCLIQSRVNHFRHPLRIVSPTGIGNEFNIAHYSEDVAAAPFDPSGSTAPNPTKNEWRITASGNGFSSYHIPNLSAAQFRVERAFRAYAASITPDLGASQTFKIGQLAGPVTFENPINGVDGDSLTIIVLQNGSAAQAISWGSGYLGHPTANGAAGQKRVYKYEFDGSDWIYAGGGNWAGP